MTPSWRIVATGLVAVATGLGTAGLSGLVIFGDWLLPAGGVLAGTAATVMLTRLAGGRALLPTAVGAASGVWLLLIVYAPNADGGRHWLPTPGAWRDGFAVLEEATRYAGATVAPAPVEPPLAGAIAAGTVALFLVAEAAAVGGGFAASTGILLAVPWLPALLLERRVPTAALAGALAAWLAAVALTRRLEGAGQPARDQALAPPPLLAVAGAVAATVALALVATPLAIGGPGWGAAPRFDLPERFVGTSRLDLEIDLRDSLTQRSEEVVLRYRAQSGPVDVLRMYTFAYFDGVSWDRDDAGDARAVTGGVLWPEDLPPIDASRLDAVTIEIDRLSQDRVPVPGVPRSIPAGTGWAYDAATDEVITDAEAGTRGTAYTVRFDRGFHSEDALRASESAIAAGGDDAVGDHYLALPARIDTDTIAAVAAAVTARAADRFEQAVLLQDFLREGGAFEYSTEVSPGGDDAVGTFLSDGRGYCIQFATAMAIMARTLDIPARFVVGFLGGDADTAGRFSVRGRDAHAWPELYFPGHGWVRFEPTPATQASVRPAYTTALGLEVPPSLDDVRPTAAPTGDAASPLPSAAPTAPGFTTDEPQASTPGGVLVAAMSAALTVVVVTAWLWWRRRRVAVDDAEAAWALLRRRLGRRAGSDTLTPAETERWVLAQGPPLSASAREALSALRGAVSDHRYSPHGSTVDAARARAWVDLVVAGARAADARRGDRAAR